MTARMIMLNWVQETSVRAAVVLSVGLLWVIAAVISGVLKVLTDLGADVTPALFTTVLVVLADEEKVPGAEVIVTVLVANKKENTLDEPLCIYWFCFRKRMLPYKFSIGLRAFCKATCPLHLFWCLQTNPWSDIFSSPHFIDQYLK